MGPVNATGYENLDLDSGRVHIVGEKNDRRIRELKADGAGAADASLRSG
jgi:hypothetical protein